MLDEVPRILHALVAPSPALGQVIKALDPCRRSRAWNSSKITAHHGIIPTAIKLDLTQLSEREQAVYALIRARYLAQFLPEHEYLKTRCCCTARPTSYWPGASRSWCAVGKR